jgi:hypothetical protein
MAKKPNRPIPPRRPTSASRQPPRRPGSPPVNTAVAVPHFREKPVRSAISRHALASLIQPEAKDAAALADMMDNDYQITLAKQTIYANIAAVEVVVKATGNDPRAALLAAHYQGLWKTHLAEMVDLFSKGRVAFERVWDYNREANLHFDRKLESLPFAETEMKIEKETGAFDGIELSYGKNGKEKLEIPAENSWWLALDATSIHPHGKSRYNGAPYVTWKERQQAIRLRRIFVQKLVLMGGVAHVPDQIELENGQSLDTFAEMAKAHDERLAGGMMVLSNKLDSEGNYEFNIDESPSTLDPAVIDNHIDGLDQEQLQSFGIPPKVVIEGDAVGSFAMVSIQRLILDALIEHILCQMERSFQKYILNKAVLANFPAATGSGGVTIKVSHEPLLDQSNQIMAQLVETILTSPQLPQILTSGIVDVMQLLETSRIPLLPGAREAIAKLFAQAGELAKAELDKAKQPIPPPGTAIHPGTGLPVAVPPGAGAANPPPAKPANLTLEAADLAASFAESSRSRSAGGKFIGPPPTIAMKKQRTRYTAHPEDGPGTESAMHNVVRDFRLHCKTHGVDMEVAGPHEDGSLTMHAKGMGGVAHVRVGKMPVSGMAMRQLPPGFIDIGVNAKLIAKTHARFGEAKGLVETIKHAAGDTKAV